MVKIKKQLVPQSVRNELTYGGTNSKKYITIHETANKGRGANAQSHANLQSNGNSRSASWQYQADDKQVIQSFPDNAQCWHASSRYYNQNSIGIEICVNSDGNYKKAVQNASELAKNLAKKYNIPQKNILQHYTTSKGKNCPAQMRSGNYGVTWKSFLDAVKGSKGSVSNSTTKDKPSKAPTGKLGLVDWMNSKGMDSSKSNRKKIAAEYNISGYDYSAKKNTELLRALQKGKPTTNKKAKVKKGAKVVLSSSAKEYATGQSIPNSVKGKTYTVQQVKKNQVLLKEIYSWVMAYDIVGSGASSGSPKPSNKKPSKSIKKGSTVTLSKSASKYTTGQSIPASVKGKKYTVQQVKGNKVLLKEIYSWVKKSDVGGGGGSSSSSGGSSSKSVSTIANQIMNDSKVPKGHSARRKYFGLSKSKYNKVKKEVNRLASGGKPKSTKKTKSKSISAIASEIVKGVDSNGKRIPNGHDARRKHYGLSKSKYNKVKKEVNRRL